MRQRQVEFQRLDTLLAMIVKAFTASRGDEERRAELLQRMRDLVASGLDGNTGLDVLPFGSYVIGLCSQLGDLDLTIDGVVTRPNSTSGEDAPLSCASLGKRRRVELLRALKARVLRARWADGRYELVQWARIPVFKFTDRRTGVPVDVSVANRDGCFKSRCLGALLACDERAAALARLVKLWAKAQGINDPTCGGFNSYALTLMAAFSLQVAQPPVLPPVSALFGMGGAADEQRPLHGGRDADAQQLEEALVRAHEYVDFGEANQESVASLLAHFFHLFNGALATWLNVKAGACVRASAWHGRFSLGGWANPQYCISVEDPFDATDNCGRTVWARPALDRIVDAFGGALAAMHDPRLDGVVGCVRLFGPHMVSVREVGNAAYRDALLALEAGSPPPFAPPPRYAATHPALHDALQQPLEHVPTVARRSGRRRWAALAQTDEVPTDGPGLWGVHGEEAVAWTRGAQAAARPVLEEEAGELDSLMRALHLPDAIEASLPPPVGAGRGPASKAGTTTGFALPPATLPRAAHVPPPAPSVTGQVVLSPVLACGGVSTAAVGQPSQEPAAYGLLAQQAIGDTSLAVAAAEGEGLGAGRPQRRGGSGVPGGGAWEEAADQEVQWWDARSVAGRAGHEPQRRRGQRSGQSWSKGRKAVARNKAQLADGGGTAGANGGGPGATAAAPALQHSQGSGWSRGRAEEDRDGGPRRLRAPLRGRGRGSRAQVAEASQSVPAAAT